MDKQMIDQTYPGTAAQLEAREADLSKQHVRQIRKLKAKRARDEAVTFSVKDVAKAAAFLDKLRKQDPALIEELRERLGVKAAKAKPAKAAKAAKAEKPAKETASGKPPVVPDPVTPEPVTAKTPTLERTIWSGWEPGEMAVIKTMKGNVPVGMITYRVRSSRTRSAYVVLTDGRRLEASTLAFNPRRKLTADQSGTVRR